MDNEMNDKQKERIRKLFEEDGHDPRIAEIHLKRLAPGGWYGIVTPPGWDQIIIDLDEKLAEINPDYRIYQVKEKFGGLRYYCESDGREEFQVLIREAEQRSSVTCEDCGEPAENREKISGWITTLCDACHDKESKLIEEGKMKWQN